jgi:hypothetical protein
MPTKKSTVNPKATQLGVELVVNALASRYESPKKEVTLTVNPPDVTALVIDYNTKIRPLASYRVASNDDYVVAKKHWADAKQWVELVKTELNPACALAYSVHQAFTGLRAALMEPGEAVMEHMGGQVLAWEAKVEAERKAEEARIQREADARHRAEVARIEAENQRLLDIATASSDCPWEDDDELSDELVSAVEMVLSPPPPEPIRLPSALPTVIGGPRSKDNPLSAECFDFHALIIECGKRLSQDPKDMSLVEFLEFAQVNGNRKARELGPDLEKVVPGVRAVRERTLARA